MCYKSGVEGIAHFRNADFSRVEAKHRMYCNLKSSSQGIGILYVEAKHRMYCNKSVAEVAKYIVKWN